MFSVSAIAWMDMPAAKESMTSQNPPRRDSSYFH